MHDRYCASFAAVGALVSARFRLGVIRTWSSKWYEEKRYAEWLHEDLKLRRFIKKKLYHAGVSKIEIERINRAVHESDITAY